MTGRKDEFASAVYEIVRLIPQGRVTTYGAIARAAGRSNHSRLVGKLMAEGGNPTEIPAHRVTAAGGILSGRHAFAEGSLEELLRQEGIEVRGNRIKDFSRFFWDPVREIGE